MSGSTRPPSCRLANVSVDSFRSSARQRNSFMRKYSRMIGFIQSSSSDGLESGGPKLDDIQSPPMTDKLALLLGLGGGPAEGPFDCRQQSTTHMYETEPTPRN